MNAARQSMQVAKYDVAGPRYSSYPTVPYWEDTPDESKWLERVGAALRASEQRGQGASIYVHIPFCRALCTFCGCSTRVTRTHTGVRPYLRAVLAEYALYREQLGVARPQIGAIHLGGGTPTFLNPAELDELVGGVLAASRLRPGAVLSVEVDPRVTTPEQLALLAQHGFRHISIGVQEFDPAVQSIVNRVQSVAQVRTVTEQARALGFESVNFDLIYGLPLQTLASIDRTMSEVCALRPDRVALYGYTHVPWIKPRQRRFTEADLAAGEMKRALHERGRTWLERAGYREIGLDYFALPSDGLWLAAQAGTLHRNFTGYTETLSSPLFGLGVSAIGDAGDAYVQNEKDLQQYHERIARRELPIHRGHLLDAEDRLLRAHILNLMTRLETRWSGSEKCTFLDGVHMRLAEFATDGLIELGAHSCRVTDAGRRFLPNICMAFDARLSRRSPDRPLFSQTA